ncbi:MAG: carboxypeptidase M32 [Planctomycetota bacterium]
MPDHATPISTLRTLLREKAVLGSVGSVVGWDEQTQLPPAGTDLRADQSSLLARLMHERATSAKLGTAIADAEAASPEGDDSVIVREARRDYDRATKLPTRLVEELARAEVKGHAAWVEARKNDDFAAFVPHLETMLKLKREEADCVGHPHHDGDPYAALLDDYEPGESPAYLDDVFASLKDPLVDLVGRINDSGKTPRRELLTRSFPVDVQRELSTKAAKAIGFEFNAGRLDVAVHPFCSGFGPGDTRMTTRFFEHDLGNSFFSTLHETGHALYEQNLPKAEHFGTALGESVSLGIHESQSRLWENLVGRSPAFWEYLWPTTQELFPDALGGESMDDFVFATNDVRPSYIRTESDEATYNLHVLLRFEIERALLSGDLSVADLPGAWDEKMDAYLGIKPDKASNGCLQDVHWSAGLIGYFPTYTLGNVYASCLFDRVTEALGGQAERDAMFARGDFRPLLDWLIANVHHHGKRHGARELVEKATGFKPTVEPLLTHLQEKATRYYGV